MAARLRPFLPWGVLGLAAAFAIRRLDNPDTWWHLASGRWIAENGSVPTVDTLSYTAAGRPWINTQWLWDLLIYWIFEIGGADLLVLLSAAVWVAATAVMIGNVRSNVGPLIATTLAVWVVLIAQERFAIRPEMTSYLLLLLVLWILDDARGSDGRRLWMLVPIMIVWVNSHALFVVGLYAIGCAAIVAVAAERLPLPPGWRNASGFGPSARKRLLIVAGICLATTLATPYFHRSFVRIPEMLSRFRTSSAFQAITEFRSPFQTLLPDAAGGAYQILLVFAVAVVALAGYLSFRDHGEADGRDREGFDLGGLAIFAGLACVSVMAYRNMGLFAMGGAPFLARSLRILQSRWKRSLGEGIRNVVAAGLLGFLIAATWFVAGNRFYRWDERTHEFGTGILEVSSPVRAADFMKKTSLPGRLYNDMTSGGYLSWSRPIDGGVFIDARNEVYDEFFEDYLAGIEDPEVWAEQADRFGVNSAILFHRWSWRWGVIRWLRDSPDWELVYFDEVVVVFVRGAGHSEIIASARSEFEAWYRATGERLMGSPMSRGYPVGHVLALQSYARLLRRLGNVDAAVVFFEKALEYDPPWFDELEGGLWLADYYRREGETARARKYIERAARADPDDERVKAALRWLAEQHP